MSMNGSLKVTFSGEIISVWHNHAVMIINLRNHFKGIISLTLETKQGNDRHAGDGRIGDSTKSINQSKAAISNENMKPLMRYLKSKRLSNEHSAYHGDKKKYVTETFHHNLSIWVSIPQYIKYIDSVITNSGAFHFETISIVILYFGFAMNSSRVGDANVSSRCDGTTFFKKLLREQSPSI